MAPAGSRPTESKNSIRTATMATVTITTDTIIPVITAAPITTANRRAAGTIAGKPRNAIPFGR